MQLRQATRRTIEDYDELWNLPSIKPSPRRRASGSPLEILDYLVAGCGGLEAAVAACGGDTTPACCNARSNTARMSPIGIAPSKIGRASCRESGCTSEQRE